MKPSQRWLIIASLLLATLAAGFMIDDEPLPEKAKRKNGASAKPVASARAKDSPRSSASSKANGAELAAAPLAFPEAVVAATAGAAGVAEQEGEGAGEGEGEKGIDPFRNKSWFVAPPPPPPAKPSAPPLPFQYLGKLSDAGETRVFLHHQGKYLVAKAGDVINGLYQVEKIAGSQMIFIYQPLKEKQVLAIGSEH